VVMVVGDTDVVAGRVKTALRDDPGVNLLAGMTDGVAAVSELRRNRADVVVLDIGAGERQALTSIRRILAVAPATRVVMAGTLSFTNVKTSMQGLLQGAAEFITTPADFTRKTTEAEFRDELMRIVHGLGRADAAATLGVDANQHPPDTGHAVQPMIADAPPLTLRAPGLGPAEVILIGSSTGGPAALMSLVPTLAQALRLPILIAQHMPANFTQHLATTLGRKAKCPAAEGQHGESLRPNHIYVAPGGRHMSLIASEDGPVIALNDDPPINFCRPSVEPLFASAAELYGRRALAVMLTGMGQDGIEGARKLVEAGGTLVAQDEATSVVWGMPGAVAQAGLCSAVLPLDDIAQEVIGLATGKR